MKTALVIGGSGPTGTHLVHGLAERGYEVVVLHRGTHEEKSLQKFEHIHTDPHFAEPLKDALGSRRFDICLATYGRVRVIAEVMAGRCDQFIGIGGVPVYLGWLEPDALFPHGMVVNTTEEHGATAFVEGDTPSSRFTYLVGSTERSVFDLHRQGAFAATYIRYPIIYGPRQVAPREWSVAKRVLDGRKKMILPDGGLAVLARCAAENAAHCVLLTVNNPNAFGQSFNCVDDQQYSLRQWAEKIVAMLGGNMSFVLMPDSIAWPGRTLFPLSRPSGHGMVSGEKARELLGYKDIVDPDLALEKTVRWYIENPPTREDYPSFTEIFDYESEDKLIAEYERAIEKILRDNPAKNPAPSHHYPHPREPGLLRDHRGR